MPLFSLQVFSFFSLLRGFFAILLVNYFYVQQKQSHGRALSKRCLMYLAKFIRKHLCRSRFFRWSCRIETCNFIKRRLRHWCFRVNFAKQFFFSRKSSNVDVRPGYKYALASQVLVAKVNCWKKIQKAINFNLETSGKKNVIVFIGVLRTQSNIYDGAF